MRLRPIIFNSLYASTFLNRALFMQRPSRAIMRLEKTADRYILLYCNRKRTRARAIVLSLFFTRCYDFIRARSVISIP